jgi:mannosyl-3-phosphoglycerate phosphatase
MNGERQGTPFLLIFTDLDGTLLDHDTYGWEDARQALNQCKELLVPIVLASSKTRAEIDLLRKELPLTGPFICENGGGVFFPVATTENLPPEVSLDKGMWRWSLGLPYEYLVKELQEIRRELGWEIRGFSDLSIEEIARLTGLERDAARLASLRQYDEPFIVQDRESVDKDALFKAAAKRGLRVTVGGRFYHLNGKNDKALAMQKVISWYKQLHEKVISVALGDSPNDFLMLEYSDYPVLIRSRHNFPALKKKIPWLKFTKETGPRGWNAAVLDILEQWRK